MDNISLKLKGNGAKLDLILPTPILNDDGKYQVALKSLSTWYAWPNITSKNNELKYTIGGVEKSIVFPPGAYLIKDIAIIIKTELKRKGDEDAFWLGASQNTLKSKIKVVEANCIVNIGDSSIKNILGWPGGPSTNDLPQGEHTSSNVLDISSVNEIMVHSNITRGTYTTNAKGELLRQSVLASFYPKVPPGYKIIFEPRQLEYTTLNTNLIQNIRVWLTDQDYNILDNGKERLSINLQLKKVV